MSKKQWQLLVHVSPTNQPIIIKTGVPGPYGVENWYILKSSKKRTPRTLPFVQNASYLFLPDKAQVHPSLSTLLDLQLFFSFFS